MSIALCRSRLLLALATCGGVACGGEAGNAAHTDHAGNGGGLGGSAPDNAGAGAFGDPGSGGSAFDSMPRPPPALHVEGRYFVDALGQRVILRGVALPDLLELDTARPGMSVNAMVDRLSDEADGFYARVVRLTVFPERWLPDPDAYLRDHLRPAVEHATERGLYVIVDWHEISDVAPVAERTAKFWRQVAPEFANQGNVLYELFNEPIEMANPSWSAWKAQAQPWVDSIRAVADNVILLGGPFWSQRIEGAASDPFDGPNLAYVGHVYPIIDPNTWAPGGAFDQVAAVRPLFITEWGYRADGGEIWNATRQSFGEPLRAFIEPRGMSWTAWCADSLWAPVMFDSNWNLLTGDAEMGGFVKEWLAGSRSVIDPAIDVPPDEPSSDGSCVPELSPSAITLLNGDVAGPAFRLSSVSCLGNVTLDFDSCSSEAALMSCVQLHFLVGEMLGIGVYYDADGQASSLDVTSGDVDAVALTNQQPVAATFAGTLTAPGGMTSPFQLSIGGCPQPPQFCLL